MVETDFSLGGTNDEATSALDDTVETTQEEQTNAESEGSTQEEQEVADSKKILGQFETDEQALRAWHSLRAKHGRVMSELRELKAWKEKQEMNDMSEEDKIAHLLDKIQVLSTGGAEKELELDGLDAQDDVEGFISTRPELQGHLGDVFRDIAQANPNVKLESLYAVKIKPLVSDLSGTRIRVKPRIAPVKDGVKSDFSKALEAVTKNPENFDKYKHILLKGIGYN